MIEPLIRGRILIVRLISLVPKQKRWQKTVFIFATLAVLSGGLFIMLKKEASFDPLPQIFPGITRDNAPPQPKEPSIVNGVLTNPDYASRRPLAVMIENHTEARPQIGLNQAAIVYEAIAEGGITRFMAVFSPFDVKKVGPVRSARQYYVEWAKGLDALYAHVGGSQDAKTLITTLGVADLDQFRYGIKAYWREPKTGVAIEHTMFTSTDKLYVIAKEARLNLRATLTPYKFKEDALAEARGQAQTLTIDFSFPTYKVLWTYDPATNSYIRAQGGITHVDRETGERIMAKTIAVAVVKRQLKSAEDGPGYIMTTTGSGKASILTDGKLVIGTWKRPTKNDMLRFYDDGGQEVALNRGQLWIEIVPPEVKYTIQ